MAEKYLVINILGKILLVCIVIALFTNGAYQGFKKHKYKLFNLKYESQIQKINNAIDNLPIIENTNNFSQTSMYLNNYPSNFDSSSRAFMSKYIGIKKDCGDSNGTCFAPKYFNTDGKKELKLKYEGACAILNNNTTTCILPQINDKGITIILDLNGKNGPNTLDKDLRIYNKKPFIKEKFNDETDEINTVSF